MTLENIYNEIITKKSFLCTGLDTDPALIPECLHTEQYPIFKFNKEIVDATAPYSIAYKPNTAFYEALGSKGWIQFEMTVNYIKEHYPKIMVIADAKRGDIGNTAKRYAKAFFENLPCDAVTLAPYMGRDSIEPFLQYNGKFAIVLALTSNKSADDFEFYGGETPLYKKVMTECMASGTPENLMFVAGATRAEALADLRSFCPDNFFLVPGVGAQGGNVSDVAKYGKNSKCGLIVNSSRGIIYAGHDCGFASAAAAAAEDLARQMAEVL